MENVEKVAEFKEALPKELTDFLGEEVTDTFCNLSVETMLRDGDFEKTTEKIAKGKTKTGDILASTFIWYSSPQGSRYWDGIESNFLASLASEGDLEEV